MGRPQPPFTVLIVEDEALLALDLEAMVTDCGHTVVADAMSLSDVEALGGLAAPDIAFVVNHPPIPGMPLRLIQPVFA